MMLKVSETISGGLLQTKKNQDSPHQTRSRLHCIMFHGASELPSFTIKTWSGWPVIDIYMKTKLRSCCLWFSHGCADKCDYLVLWGWWSEALITEAEARWPLDCARLLKQSAGTMWWRMRHESFYMYSTLRPLEGRARDPVRSWRLCVRSQKENVIEME